MEHIASKSIMYSPCEAKYIQKLTTFFCFPHAGKNTPRDYSLLITKSDSVQAIRRTRWTFTKSLWKDHETLEHYSA